MATTEYYEKALKSGQKSYREKLSQGQSPYLPVLDRVLEYSGARSEIYIGLLDIPLKHVIGTKTANRSQSFAANFAPILDKDSEFAVKWERLADAHVEEGIREPIKVFEYMNRFYVQEGNKRVSVLKFFDAFSVTAYVYRILPPWSDAPEVQAYYEYLKFFDLCGIMNIEFSAFSGYRKLVEATGYSQTERWSEDQIMNFSALSDDVLSIYEEQKMEKRGIDFGDVLLRAIQLYGYESLRKEPFPELREKVLGISGEVEASSPDETVELQMDPTEKIGGPIGALRSLMIPSVSKYKVAFINEKTPHDSAWTYSHDLGRAHLQNTYPDLKINVYNDALKDGDADAVLETAVADGCDIIFTTSPRLLDASIKAAVAHPDVIVLNCSLNTGSKAVRTYYGRIYEPKFLTGLVAGAMCRDGEIGYVADFPLYGTIANINAFALGVQMTNPNATVKLFWSRLNHPDDRAAELKKLSYICGPELITPNSPGREFGLYCTDGGIKNLIAPVWNWGQYYVRILENIRHGLWKSEDDTKALNYWWGLSAGVVSTICSQNIPPRVLKLVDLMEETIKRQDMYVFEGILYAQNGKVISNEECGRKTPQEIMTMDWLLSNIDGRIPAMDELTEGAKEVTRIQGIAAINDDEEMTGLGQKQNV